MRGLVLITAPAAEPFDVAEAKVHLRVDGADEDSLIASLISAARRMAEARTGRALLPQTWKLSLEQFPYGDKAIIMPKPPFVSVMEFTYTDSDGAVQTLPVDDYVVARGMMAARIVPAYGKVWPASRHCAAAVNITFTAGYPSAAFVPADLNAWMKIAVATLYDNRDVVLRGGDSSSVFMPRGFTDALLDPYIVPVIA